MLNEKKKSLRLLNKKYHLLDAELGSKEKNF